MSNFKEASENIKRLGVMFKGLIEFSDEIEKMGSLENHVKELESKKDNLKKEIENLNYKKIDSDNVLKDNLEEAQNTIAKAKEDSSKLQKEMQLEKSKIDDYAKQQEKETKEAMDKIHNDALENLELVKQNLKQIELELTEKSAKLDKVNQALDKIKGGI